MRGASMCIRRTVETVDVRVLAGEDGLSLRRVPSGGSALASRMQRSRQRACWAGSFGNSTDLQAIRLKTTKRLRSYAESMPALLWFSLWWENTLNKTLGLLYSAAATELRSIMAREQRCGTFAVSGCMTSLLIRPGSCPLPNT